MKCNRALVSYTPSVGHRANRAGRYSVRRNGSPGSHAMKEVEMEDEQTLERIGQLVDEEHALYKRAEQDHGLTNAERARLRALEVALDQCWDLLQQRRARREFGMNPDD